MAPSPEVQSTRVGASPVKYQSFDRASRQPSPSRGAVELVDLPRHASRKAVENLPVSSRLLKKPPDKLERI